MKLKHLLSLSLIGLATAPAFAAEPDFEFERIIELPATAGQFYPRMVAGESDTDGGVYFTENAVADNIYYLANPLTVTTAADSALAFDAAALSPGFSTGSWFGLTVDPNGTVFASGSGVNRTAVAMIKRSGTTFTGTEVTMPSAYGSDPGYIRLGGCAAVGVNRIVASGYSDGSLHFFTINYTDSTAFLEGTVAGPGGFAGIATDVTYADGKIYMSNASVSPTGNGGLWSWATDGTHTGTNTPVKLVDVIAGQSSSNSQYNVLGYSATYKALAINEGHNVANQQGWKMYNTEQPGSTWTSFDFLNGSETGAPGALAVGDAAMGAVFFKQGTDEYFMGSNEDAVRRMYIYKIVPGSSVSDWSVY